MTFAAWMKAEFDADQIRDIADHGADAGWSGLTYYSDTVALYALHSEEIWEWLGEDAEGMGLGSPLRLIATFKVSSDVRSAAQFENMLVWYAAERTARNLTDKRDES